MNSTSHVFDVIIIGAGPAGLFTAANLKSSQSVLILDRNPSAGRKLLIAGTGQCNITHSGSIEDFFDHYGQHGRFLRTALRAFSNQDVIAFFYTRGLHTITDKNGKVFPRTRKSKDVLDILIDQCIKNKIVFGYNQHVLEVGKVSELFCVRTNRDEFRCKKLVIATGGKSYPQLGSTGDGYAFARSLGHTVVVPGPALTPVIVKDFPFTELTGVSLTDRSIYLYRNNKKIHQHCGDIGFTPRGVSGPGILDFSRYIEPGDILKIDFVNREPEIFLQQFQEEAVSHGNSTIKKFLKSYEIPERLIMIILTRLGLEGSEKLGNISKKVRSSLIESFCQYPLQVKSLAGFELAMVTRGGVSLEEVSSKTMESKLVPRLFFAGEVLDIDGDTGGYNIQAAFSTGFLVAASL